MDNLGKHLGKLIPHRPGGIAYARAVLFPQALAVMDNMHLKICMLPQEVSAFDVETVAAAETINPLMFAPWALVSLLFTYAGTVQPHLLFHHGKSIPEVSNSQPTHSSPPQSQQQAQVCRQRTRLHAREPQLYNTRATHTLHPHVVHEKSHPHAHCACGESQMRQQVVH